MSGPPDNHVLVLDLEATCWQGPIPPGEEQEVIEIGVCLLNPATKQRAGRRGILVRPERSRVSEFCTSLTTLTQQQVDAGLSFREACAELERDYLSRARVWASWGAWDRRFLLRACPAFGVRYPLSGYHVNAKQLFAAAYGLPRPTGMPGALRAARRPLVGTHHRGVDDAWNIAELLGLALERVRPGCAWEVPDLLALTRIPETEVPA